MVDAVDRIALTTGKREIVGYKRAQGYEYVADKFARAGLTTLGSHLVEPPRGAEGPRQLGPRARRSPPSCPSRPGPRSARSSSSAGWWRRTRSGRRTWGRTATRY